VSVRSLSLAFLIALLALAPPAAAARWRDIGPITPSGTPDVGFHYAVDSRGNLTFLYQQFDINDAPDGPMMYRDRLAREAPGAPARFPYPVRPGDLPELTVTAGGEQLAAWVVIENGSDSVLVSTRRNGGAWSEPQVVADRLLRATGLRIAAAPGGEAVIMWATVHRVGSGKAVYDTTVNAAVRPAGSASFGAVAELGRGDIYPVDTALALDETGNGLVAWTEPGTGVHVVRHAAGRGFAHPQTLGASARYAPRLAVAPSGRALLAWFDLPPRQADGPAFAALGTTRRGFKDPVELGSSASLPAVAIDDTVAAVSWEESRRRGGRVRAVLVRPGQTLAQRPTSTVARHSTLSWGPTVARGRVAFAWEAKAVVRARTARADGDFTPAQTLSSRRNGSQLLAVESNRRGEPFMVWVAYRAHRHGNRIQAAKAGFRSGRFARRQNVARNADKDGLDLIPGVGGSMLLAFGTSGYDLHTYGER